MASRVIWSDHLSLHRDLSSTLTSIQTRDSALSPMASQNSDCYFLILKPSHFPLLISQPCILSLCSHLLKHPCLLFCFSSCFSRHQPVLAPAFWWVQSNFTSSLYRSQHHRKFISFSKSGLFFFSLWKFCFFPSRLSANSSMKPT